ncbi:hypothetical protein HK102_005016 [Quaeritorhiza haematococci]|nr:hypothetical protein HK102_005016 [Quaeritorhiza haematococci]
MDSDLELAFAQLKDVLNGKEVTPPNAFQRRPSVNSNRYPDGSSTGGSKWPIVQRKHTGKRTVVRHQSRKSAKRGDCTIVRMINDYCSISPATVSPYNADSRWGAEGTNYLMKEGGEQEFDAMSDTSEFEDSEDLKRKKVAEVDVVTTEAGEQPRTDAVVVQSSFAKDRKSVVGRTLSKNHRASGASRASRASTIRSVSSVGGVQERPKSQSSSILRMGTRRSHGPRNIVVFPCRSKNINRNKNNLRIVTNFAAAAARPPPLQLPQMGASFHPQPQPQPAQAAANIEAPEPTQPSEPAVNPSKQSKRGTIYRSSKPPAVVRVRSQRKPSSTDSKPAVDNLIDNLASLPIDEPILRKLSTLSKKERVVLSNIIRDATGGIVPGEGPKKKGKKARVLPPKIITTELFAQRRPSVQKKIRMQAAQHQPRPAPQAAQQSQPVQKSQVSQAPAAHTAHTTHTAQRPTAQRPVHPQNPPPQAHNEPQKQQQRPHQHLRAPHLEVVPPRGSSVEAMAHRRQASADQIKYVVIDRHERNAGKAVTMDREKPQKSIFNASDKESLEAIIAELCLKPGRLICEFALSTHCDLSIFDSATGALLCHVVEELVEGGAPNEIGFFGYDSHGRRLFKIVRAPAAAPANKQNKRQFFRVGKSAAGPRNTPTPVKWNLFRCEWGGLYVLRGSVTSHPLNFFYKTRCGPRFTLAHQNFAGQNVDLSYCGKSFASDKNTPNPYVAFLHAPNNSFARKHNSVHNGCEPSSSYATKIAAAAGIRYPPSSPLHAPISPLTPLSPMGALSHQPASKGRNRENRRVVPKTQKVHPNEGVAACITAAKVVGDQQQQQEPVLQCEIVLPANPVDTKVRNNNESMTSSTPPLDMIVLSLITMKYLVSA